MSKLQSKEYISATKFALLIGFNIDKLRLYLKNHKEEIDSFQTGNRIKVHESEVEKLKYIHTLYGKGLSASQVHSILKGEETPEELLKPPEDALNGLSRKQLIDAFFAGSYPVGTCFYCPATSRTAIFQEDRLEDYIKGYCLTINKASEQWVQVEFKRLDETSLQVKYV